MKNLRLSKYLFLSAWVCCDRCSTDSRETLLTKRVLSFLAAFKSWEKIHIIWKTNSQTAWENRLSVRLASWNQSDGLCFQQCSGEEVAKTCSNIVTCSIMFRLLGLGISVCKTEGGVVVRWGDLLSSMASSNKYASSHWRSEALFYEMATHSSTPAWKIPWREEPGRLQSMG